MSKIILALIFAIIFANSAFAQSAKIEQWEYLIISVDELDNNNYTDSGTRTEIPNLQPVITKTDDQRFGFTVNDITYYAVNFNFVRIQAVLDYYGKSGWELTGVIPIEGKDGNPQGNARLIFKRRFDEKRSSREAEERRRQAELQKQTNELQAKSKSASQIKTDVKKAETPKVEIIDADALELQQKNEALQSVQEKQIRQLLEAIKSIPLTIKYLKSSSVIGGNNQISSNIIIDGTSTLLKDNKYRASEARKFLKEKAIEIANQIGLQINSDSPFYGVNNRNTSINISLVVNYQGTSKIIDRGEMTGVYTDKTGR